MRIFAYIFVVKSKSHRRQTANHYQLCSPVTRSHTRHFRELHTNTSPRSQTSFTTTETGTNHRGCVTSTLACFQGQHDRLFFRATHIYHFLCFIVESPQSTPVRHPHPWTTCLALNVFSFLTLKTHLEPMAFFSGGKMVGGMSL